MCSKGHSNHMGTHTLAHYDPGANNPKFYQAGLAIVTPISLTNLWKRVQEGKVTVEAAEKEPINCETLSHCTI